MVRLSTRLGEESDTASPSWTNGPPGVAATAPATTGRNMAPRPNGRPPSPPVAIFTELQQPFLDMARSLQAVGSPCHVPTASAERVARKRPEIILARNNQVALYSTVGAAAKLAATYTRRGA